MFGERVDPLSREHAAYLFRYLSTLGCSHVLEESVYIDRDFHEEFSEFYGTTPAQPPSTCRRLHFFADVEGGLDASAFDRFLMQESTIEALQSAYLGNCVIRPAGIAAFGRTLLRNHASSDGLKVRHFDPARDFDVNLCGIELRIRCVPWQQQDMGVCACAGVALWSMMQSVAHREGIAVPTTVRVARAATKYTLPFGRALPPGLNLGQLCEGIRELGLAPTVIMGDVRKDGEPAGFSRARFAKLCALILRARLPMLLTVPGSDDDEGHAVLAVGFQQTIQRATTLPLDRDPSNRAFTAIYVHDDNFGPSMRHEVSEQRVDGDSVVVLHPVSPNRAVRERGQEGLVPSMMLVAMPHKLRLSPAELLVIEAVAVSKAKQQIRESDAPSRGAWADTAFVLLRDYLGSWATALGLQPRRLARLRKAVQEIQPLPRYLGLIRIHFDSVAGVDLIVGSTAAPQRRRLVGAVAYSDDGLLLADRLGLAELACFIDNR